jgi:hypothetical protein
MMHWLAEVMTCGDESNTSNIVVLQDSSMSHNNYAEQRMQCVWYPIDTSFLEVDVVCVVRSSGPIDENDVSIPMLFLLAGWTMVVVVVMVVVIAVVAVVQFDLALALPLLYHCSCRSCSCCCCR